MTIQLQDIVKFRHIKNQMGKLFCTVCTVEMPNATLIGVAVCSSRDQFSRKTGRELAAKRAKIAMMSLRNTLPVRFQRRATLEMQRNDQIKKFIPIEYKSIYIPKEQHG